ncbi:putative GPI-anchored protein 7 [Yamadazyma tenuis]|uniref:CFEM-domain-containing protein n=1 Tax=Candida tenuis (strain ATCC 10573 / BCRC 21748 / CBS 615 / JCM 9827 / NBRC 10315 / NRRL Y-1498 / VKM Y-70) TaxID=590646 RepID=G3B1I1_CANTC|nr:CFEM-domain-containing protein [Yamadazyma tenuis ATCC 10573]EGV65197.1 CFEM-domain-containing protein [Yamadazyma tenuis ATCC 10573]WEJ97772.1 putative GPI-anchored protein 7 [Yamadazyma tenuis]
MQFGLLILYLSSVITASNWDTYPQVPKTASINGFADPIYSELPSCAKDCVKVSVGNTPCPYWDTGCLCVMPQWSGLVGQCIAADCEGEDVVSATSLAYSLCSSVGANLWLMPSSITAALTAAAGVYNEAVPSPTETAFNSLLGSLGISVEVQSSSSITSEAEAEAEATGNNTSSDSDSSSGSSSASSSGTSSSSSSRDGAMEIKVTGSLFMIILGSLFAILM